MSLQIMNPYARESRMRRSEIPMSMMRRRNRCRCRCICGCRRTPGSRRVECGRCGHHVCPGYCLAVELSGRALCRHCLSTNCNGVPEPWQFMEIVELRFYVSLLSFRRQLMVDADHLLVVLLAQFLRPSDVEHLQSDFQSL